MKIKQFKRSNLRCRIVMDRLTFDHSRLLKLEIYLKSYILVCVLLGYAVLDSLNILEKFSVPKTSLGIVILLFILTSVYFLIILEKTKRFKTLVIIIALTDIFFFTLLIHYWGGIDAPVLAVLYLIPVPFFSIIISPWSGYLVAAASYLAYILLCVLEYSGIVPTYGSTAIDLERLVIVPFFLIFCFFTIAFYVGYFSNVLRQGQQALARAKAAIEQNNLTLEEKINQRTQDLEVAKFKLEEYSRKLEEAYNEKSLQLEAAQKRLESSISELTLKYNYDRIIGNSLKMKEIFSLMDKITDFDVSTLIQGESGTGKELIAKAIHYNGPRKDKAFIIQNCSAIPETLLESELFGHVKGAFTGANQDRKGLFVEADGGTLFLDEIGDMTPGMQAKLLRAIQEGEIRPVGGKRVVRVDVRLISATNIDLKEAVEKGAFREDLYYRLNGVTISIPPLRERKEDILLLIDHFTARFSEENNIVITSLSPEAKRLLLSYSWPGNVRELENIIKGACLLAQGDPLQLEDFRYKPELFSESNWASKAADARGGKGGQNGGLKMDPPGIKSLRELEKKAIEQALRVCHGKRKEAAQLLGIPLRTLYDKLKKYEIS